MQISQILKNKKTKKEKESIKKKTLLNLHLSDDVLPMHFIVHDCYTLAKNNVVQRFIFKCFMI